MNAAGPSVSAKRALLSSAFIFPLLALASFSIGAEAALITFTTFTYHIWMRLAAGYLVRGFRISGNAAIFRISEKEYSLICRTQIRKWKHMLPTYDPAGFDASDLISLRSVMLHSELTHMIISVLSFLPLIAAFSSDYLRSSWPVFLATSAFSSAFDYLFVLEQRYNRKRTERIIGRRA